MSSWIICQKIRSNLDHRSIRGVNVVSVKQRSKTGQGVGCGLSILKYVVGSKSFRPDIQKPRQMENAVRDI